MTLARLIPPELLAKIFEHASEAGWTRAPVVVSHVCSTWRAAAKSHPRVWSRITVDLNKRDPVGWTEHWLSMARQAPLYVKIILTNPTTLLERVMTLLLERSEQWISLTLDLHLADTRKVLAVCTARRFTGLRSIRASLFAIDESIMEAENTTNFADAFQDAPTLSSVSIVGNVFPRDLPPRLTSLCIEYSDHTGSGMETPRSIIRALQSLPDLETLTLQLGVISSALMNPFGTLDIELPKLTTLVYEDLGAGEFPILDYLSAPSLTHLTAHAQPDPDAYDTSTGLVSFIEDSQNIETLELDGVDIWPAQWLSILPLLPKLRKLCLHDSDIDDEVIESMFGKSGSCPDLQQIDLRWCQHVRGRTLLQLVESRMKEGGQEIEEVAAIGCSLVRKQDVMQLASLTTFRVVVRERDKLCREILISFYMFMRVFYLTWCSPR